MAFLNRKLQAAIDRILEKSRTPPIIIIQSDHGSGFRMHHESVDKTDLRELLVDSFGIRIFFVDLIESHNNGDLGSFGMCDRFSGLWHDSVISGDNQNHDISSLCTTRPHGCKSCMPGRVKEGD